MGQLIEFYRPALKPPVEPVVVEDEPTISASDILRELLGTAETIDEVVILMRDKNGAVALVSNLESPAENLLFMKRVENYIVTADSQAVPPKGTA